jgi:hypothetical protein
MVFTKCKKRNCIEKEKLKFKKQSPSRGLFIKEPE